jgi:hypothetical protein
MRHNRLLKQFATACQAKTPTIFADKLLAYCLENADIIQRFQNELGTNPAYRITGFFRNRRGHIEYIIGQELTGPASQVAYPGDTGGIVAPLEVAAHDPWKV